jgi:hypothetical protein
MDLLILALEHIREQLMELLPTSGEKRFYITRRGGLKRLV